VRRAARCDRGSGSADRSRVPGEPRPLLLADAEEIGGDVARSLRRKGIAVVSTNEERADGDAAVDEEEGVDLEMDLERDG